MNEYDISRINYFPDRQWQPYGSCYSTDEELFFPQNGRPSNETKKFCSNCLVRPRCAIEGTLAEEKGIWGGIGHIERSKALDNKIFRKKLFFKLLEETSNSETIQEWMEYSREISSIDDKDDRIVVIASEGDISSEILRKISFLYFIYGYEESDEINKEAIISLLENNNIILKPDLFCTVHKKTLEILKRKIKIDVKKYIKVPRISKMDDDIDDYYNL
jgi:WhiB family redox-sensing transcriptional regulator